MAGSVCAYPAGRPVDSARARSIQNDTIAFVHVGVVPMDRERIVPDRTVLVAAGRIVSIQPATDRVPAGARRIDGSGAYLMPGLADLHVHLFEPAQRLLYLANGVTTVLSLGGGGDSLIRARDAIRAGTLAGPRIYSSGNWLDGDPPVRSINTVLRTPEDARREVAAEAGRGVDFIKVYANLAPDVFAAVVEAAAAHHLRVTGHIPNRVAPAAAIALHADVAHAAQLLRYFDGAPTGDAVARLAAELRRNEVSVTTTLVMFDRMVAMRGDTSAYRAIVGQRWARCLSPRTLAWWLSENPVLGLPRSAGTRVPYEATTRLVAQLHEAGVSLLLGTDAGLWGNPPGYSIHDELRLLVDAGLSPYEALRLGTTNAARYLARHVPRAAGNGTIGVGQPADLLLVSANPLADVGVVAHPLGVMARGTWYPANTLKAMLDSLAAEYHPADRSRATESCMTPVPHR